MRKPPEPRYVISTESAHGPAQRATGLGAIVGWRGARLGAHATDASEKPRADHERRGTLVGAECGDRVDARSPARRSVRCRDNDTREQPERRREHRTVVRTHVDEKRREPF